MIKRSIILSVIVPMVQANDIEGLRAFFAMDANPAADRGTYEYHANKFVRFLDTGKLEFSIFAESGNIKLPFLAFSSLAVATCPGMGSCADYCYSMRAWRYPAAMFRQIQNTLLLANESGRDMIRAEFARILNKRKFAEKDRVDFRLYVDGDFSNESDMGFWFDLIRDNPKVAAYGYSKSWGVFRAYQNAGNTFPSNYVLNLSSGSAYEGDAEITRYMESLPVTRGHFVAVPIKTDRKYSAPKGEYREPGYRAAVREAFQEKAFVCPGQCGTCTGKGHACGISSIGVPIVIGIH
jgi:hypothetical protein